MRGRLCARADEPDLSEMSSVINIGLRGVQRVTISYPGDGEDPENYQLLSLEHRHLWRPCCPPPEEPGDMTNLLI